MAYQRTGLNGIFTKWLDLLVVSRASCKKKRSWPYGFVTFAFLKDRIEGSKTMEGCKVQGRTISVHEAVSRKSGETSKSLISTAGAKVQELPAVHESNSSSRRPREELVETCVMQFVHSGKCRMFASSLGSEKK